jgi:uncharacterized lipoprotein YehR (DUF1307 family)
VSKALDKRAIDAILALMEELSEVTTEVVMDIVRPHLMFDPRAAREREVRRKTHQLMAKFKDDKGVRTCFSYTDALGQSKYVNIDKTFDINALNGVDQQLNQKVTGLRKSGMKSSRRILELSGQMGLFGDDEAQDG